METISTAIQKFNVPQELAISLQERFEPFEKQAKEWEEKAKALVVTDPGQKDLMLEARKARLALRQIRLAVEKKHEQEKAEFLKKGQVLDLIKRTLVGYIEPLEKHLQAQEDFAEVEEAKRKKALYDERIKALEPFRVPMDGLNNVPFGEMNDDAFNNLLSLLKAGQEARENAQKEAERKRQEEEQRVKDERERQRQENERLKKRSDRVRQLMALGFFYSEQYQSFIRENDPDAMNIGGLELETLSDQEFTKIIAKFTELVAIQKQKIKQAQDELAAKLKAETEAREKLETEKREREEKEEKERKEKAAADRKLKRAPDKIKLLNLADRIELIEPITLKDDQAKAIYDDAVRRIKSIVMDIRDKSESL